MNLDQLSGTHLCDEGASGWRGPICPSSKPSRLPPVAAAVCRGKTPVAKINFSQSALAAETRTAWRFPPRTPRRKRIGSPGPSCWTRCLRVDQLEGRCVGQRALAVSLQRPRTPTASNSDCSHSSCCVRVSFKVWLYSPSGPQIPPHDCVATSSRRENEQIETRSIGRSVPLFGGLASSS